MDFLNYDYNLHEKEINDCNNYFKVVVKMGHVSRNKFYCGTLYIKAKNGKVAASIARNTSRVKHDRKDAILSVTKISYDDYKIGNDENKKNPYFNCHNRQEQFIFIDSLRDKIFEEPMKIFYKNKKHSLRNKFYANEREYNLVRFYKGDISFLDYA